MPETAPRRLVSRGLRGLFVAWSAYLALLTCSFYWGVFGIERNHLDSAWLIEASIAAACAISQTVEAGSDAAPAGQRFGLIAFGGVVAAALLYFPALSVGLLSDDFTLLHRATDGSFAPIHDAMFRPAPVVAWAALSHLLPPSVLPASMHAVNIALHGLNAALVAALARRRGASTLIAVLCAALFLTFPGSVEAVAWASGIQDVLAASCLLGLLCLLTGRQTGASDAGMLLLLGVALLTKESAVSGVVLAGVWCVLLDDRERRARRLGLCLVAAGVTIGYVGWRLSVAGSRFDNQPSTTRRGLEHFLTSPFAALGSPWSSADLARSPLVGIAPCLLLLAAIVMFVWQPRPPRQTLAAVLLLVCALVAVAPVGRYFFVAPDLEGSRYLYLSSAFLALFVADLLAHTRTAREGVRAGLVAAVVVLFAIGVHVHLRPWRDAAQSRDALLGAIGQAAERERCSTVAVVDVPDNVDGAYVFRNGLAEALAQHGSLVRLVPAGSGAASDACTVRGPWR